MTQEPAYRQASPNPPSKAELLAALRQSGAEFVEKVAALPARSLEAGRYENGWNARQILAHVAAIEWTYANLIDIARSADPGATGDSVVPPTREVQGGMDAYNARQVEKRKDATVAELLDEFARNREKTIAAVEALDEHLLDVHIRSGGGIPGPLGSVLFAVAIGHVRQHMTDILGGTSA
jgi:uncharacterized damage-inducible protein DinB